MAEKNKGLLLSSWKRWCRISHEESVAHSGMGLVLQHLFNDLDHVALV